MSCGRVVGLSGIDVEELLKSDDEEGEEGEEMQKGKEKEKEEQSNPSSSLPPSLSFTDEREMKEKIEKLEAEVFVLPSFSSLFPPLTPFPTPIIFYCSSNNERIEKKKEQQRGREMEKRARGIKQQSKVGGS